MAAAVGVAEVAEVAGDLAEAVALREPGEEDDPAEEDQESRGVERGREVAADLAEVDLRWEVFRLCRALRGLAPREIVRRETASQIDKEADRDNR